MVASVLKRGGRDERKNLLRNFCLDATRPKNSLREILAIPVAEGIYLALFWATIRAARVLGDGRLWNLLSVASLFMTAGEKTVEPELTSYGIIIERVWDIRPHVGCSRLLRALDAYKSISDEVTVVIPWGNQRSTVSRPPTYIAEV